MVKMMKHCSRCRVDILTPGALCPLCGAPLADTGEAEISVYPRCENKAAYHFIKRLLFFLSVVVAIVCIAVNYLTSADLWWWTLVVTALVYTWIAVPHAMRRGGNGGGKILMQVICASALTVLIDMETGFYGWAVDYVVPVILCAGIVSVVLLIIVRPTNWAFYVLYQAILALFGFVPIVLYFTGVAHALIPALIVALLSAASITGMIVFGDKSIKNEFRRRLRF